MLSVIVLVTAVTLVARPASSEFILLWLRGRLNRDFGQRSRRSDKAFLLFALLIAHLSFRIPNSLIFVLHLSEFPINLPLRAYIQYLIHAK
jgi:hypothetical protein